MGFEVDTAVVQQISYYEHRTVVDDLSFLIDDMDAAAAWMQSEIIGRKFSHWSYEKEWRLHVTLEEAEEHSGLYFETFNPQFRLNKVLLGSRCDIHRTTVQRAVGDLSGVQIIRTKLSPFEYAVCDDRYTHDWG